MLIHLNHCNGTCSQSTNMKEINYPLRNMPCYIWCIEVITWIHGSSMAIISYIKANSSWPVQVWLEAKWRYWKLLWTYNDRSKASPSFSCWAELLQVQTWMWYKTLHLQKNNLICSEMCFCQDCEDQPIFSEELSLNDNEIEDNENVTDDIDDWDY